MALGLGMLSLLLRLGFWQLERAEVKEDALTRYSVSQAASPQELSRFTLSDDSSQWQFRRARASGTFLAHRQYLLDNRTHETRAGYHVLTPLTMSEGTILVNRGWIPVGDDRRVLPSVEVSTPSSMVSGRLVLPPRPGLLLGSDGYDRGGWPRVVQTVDLEKIGEQLGVRVLPALLELDPDHVACEVCAWRPVGGISPQRHRGYALQWFSLAAALVVLMGIIIWMEFRREQA